MALHGKLEYFTDILKTLLNDLVEQYVAKNPKLMLRRYDRQEKDGGGGGGVGGGGIPVRVWWGNNKK